VGGKAGSNECLAWKRMLVSRKLRLWPLAREEEEEEEADEGGEEEALDLPSKKSTWARTTS